MQRSIKEEEKFKELLSAFALDGEPYLKSPCGNKINAAAGYSRRGV